jgi:hypothetical protein
MNIINKACVCAVTVAFTFVSGNAFAQSAATKEEKAQMKADESALAREKAQSKADQKALKADSKSGKMAAESPDAEKVYKDKQAVKGQKKDIVKRRWRFEEW